MLSSSGLKEEIPKSNVDPYAKCSPWVKANSVLCTKCGNWVQGRCKKLKRMTQVECGNMGMLYGERVMKHHKGH